ncbi:MAG: hypothetical protein ACP5J9_07050 [Dictyoglomus sp.]
MKNVFLIVLIIILTFSISFSQSLNINGNTYIDTYFSIFFGNPYLLSLNPNIPKGIYIYQNSQFYLNYHIPKFTLDFSYISHPTDIMELFLNFSEFKIRFSNLLNLNFSPLSLYNKKVNGIYITYENNTLSLKGIISKIEGLKKYKNFYGNGTPGPYFLEDTFLTPFTEKVYLNGNLLQRDFDYAIDYKQRIISFSFVITKNDYIVIEYESPSKEIYNLSGFSLNLSALNLSYLNLEKSIENTQNSFWEVGINMEKDENNLLNLRRSFFFVNNMYSGYADYLKFALSKELFTASLEYLYAEKGYIYLTEVLGNNNLLSDSKYIHFSLSLLPFSSLSYIYDFENKITKGEEFSKQNHTLILNTNNSKAEFSYSYEKSKEEIGITYTYYPLSLNSMYKKTISNSYVSSTYSMSLSPSLDFLNSYFLVYSKDYYSDKAYFRDFSYTIGISIKSKSFELNMGEKFNKKENLNPDTPIYLAQIFMTEGVNFSFQLSYPTIDINSVSVYINNILVQNNSTFTYLFPDGSYKTYTLNLSIYENRVDLFFVDNNGIHPPPPDLSLTIYYLTIIPQESYYQSHDLQLKFTSPKISSSASLQRIEQDFIYDYLINFSARGTILKNLWIDLTNIYKIYEKNNKLLLKSVYFFLPSYIYLDLNINSFPYAKTILFKINPVLTFGEDFINFSLEHLENTYYEAYLKYLSLNLEFKKKFSQNELKAHFYKTWRTYTSSVDTGTYLLNSESINLLRELNKSKYELFIIHEKYNTNLEKYTVIFTYIPNKSEKFTNNCLYIKGIYSALEQNYSFILQIGGNISVNF